VPPRFAKDNRNYRCYGAEALAVADGVVVEVRAGNHIALDLGHGHYAHYGHFQPGSIRVRKGDRVRRGQVLGLVGNSGNSTEPHLHFQISDGPAILASDGLPYELDTFVHDGKRVRDELPRTGWAIDFVR
jgi:murein DD-endopeptidase MepM/ murein hydrolase activator NlpD